MFITYWAVQHDVNFLVAQIFVIIEGPLHISNHICAVEKQVLDATGEIL